MNRFFEIIWPRPEKISAHIKNIDEQENKKIDKRIKDLKSFQHDELPVYLEAARKILDEEDRRKSGAETRATTFIAAVATLVPLMTWTLSNPDNSSCSKGWGCTTWSLIFFLSVFYFATAAYWALRSLKVANYHIIGVEDLTKIKENNNEVSAELIKNMLFYARKNRETINKKLTFIKVAQARFFNGLVILAFLLMIDPLFRFGVLVFIRDQFKSSPTPPTELQAPNSHIQKQSSDSKKAQPHALGIKDNPRVISI
jgi:hypothetical protein